MVISNCWPRWVPGPAGNYCRKSFCCHPWWVQLIGIGLLVTGQEQALTADPVRALPGNCRLDRPALGAGHQPALPGQYSIMLCIGLTGGIGCGKSVVAQMFSDLGTPVIDADSIAHQLVEPGSALLDEIIDQLRRAVPSARRQPRP